MTAKPHYRKAFDSPYLSSQDLTGPTTLTIKHVALESDMTKKTKDLFNTAHFVESELRPGEKLKPMILNATNSKTLRNMTDSPYIEDWRTIAITVYVDHNVKFGREIVDGLRISNVQPKPKPVITPKNKKLWDRAKSSYLEHGNLSAVLTHAEMSESHQKKLIGECNVD